MKVQLCAMRNINSPEFWKHLFGREAVGHVRDFSPFLSISCFLPHSAVCKNCFICSFFLPVSRGQNIRETWQKQLAGVRCLPSALGKLDFSD